MLMQGSSRYLQAVAAANAIATGSVHPSAGLTSFLSHCRKTSYFNSDILLTPAFQLISWSYYDGKVREYFPKKYREYSKDLEEFSLF